MATKKITPLEFQHFKKATDKERALNDGGGLYVRVRSIAEGGGVSFRYRFKLEGKQQWLTFEAEGLKEARAKAEGYQKQVNKGINPALELKLEKTRNKQAQLAEQAALAKLNARLTVTDLFTQWYDIRLTNRKDKEEVKHTFYRHVLPVIGGLFVEEVRKLHITQVTNPLVQRGVNVMANRVFGMVRQMFQFAVDQDIITANPTAGLSKAKIGGKEVERDRVLCEDEIKALARQMPDAGLLKPTECAIWLALSTLCRIGELSRAKWADVDIEGSKWRIPEANSKNGKAHTIHLSGFAKAQLRVLKDCAASDTWLYPNRDDSGHVCEKSITKQIQGRQTDKVLSGRSRCNQALVLQGGKWTPHDLRRTGATLMGNLGVRPDVIEKCLNHTEENKVKRIYQRQELKAEQAAAWQLLGDRLNLLVRTDNENILVFHKKIV